MDHAIGGKRDLWFLGFGTNEGPEIQEALERSGSERTRAAPSPTVWSRGDKSPYMRMLILTPLMAPQLPKMLSGSKLVEGASGSDDTKGAVTVFAEVE